MGVTAWMVAVRAAGAIATVLIADRRSRGFAITCMAGRAGGISLFGCHRLIGRPGQHADR